MEMNTIISQMSEKFSVNITEEVVTKSAQYNSKTETFETVMSARMSESDKTDVKTGVKTGATRTVSDKRQTEMTCKENNDIDVKQDSESGVVKDTDRIQKQDEMQLNDVSKVEQEAISEWKEELKLQICEDLNLTPEELENIMAQLGLQMVDLQDVTNLQQLVLVAAGESDNMLLLTNEELGQTFQTLAEDVTNVTQEVQEKFHISENEFPIILRKDNETSLNDTSLQIPETDKTEQKVVLKEPEVLMSLENNSEQVDMTNSELEQNESALQNVIADAQEKVEADTTKTEKVQSVFVNEETEIAKVVETVVENVQNKEAFADEETKAKKVENSDNIKVEVSVEGIETEQTDKKQNTTADGNGEQSLFEQLMSHLTTEKVNVTENVTDRVTVAEQMREIVNQVVEQIKITVNADTSAMEIQLNPENLGKVNLSVVAKEGHITAQFVTENEMAKYALEGQLQQLRETLGEQGLKVDEVEVTVSNFDFSQSNQANTEEQKQRQQSEFSKRVTRNLNMNTIGSMEALTEEEQLAAKIMQENGNQIDYTA